MVNLQNTPNVSTNKDWKYFFLIELKILNKFSTKFNKFQKQIIIKTKTIILKVAKHIFISFTYQKQISRKKLPLSSGSLHTILSRDRKGRLRMALHMTTLHVEDLAPKSQTNEILRFIDLIDVDLLVHMES